MSLAERRNTLIKQNLLYRDRKLGELRKLMQENRLAEAIDRYNKGRLLFETRRKREKAA